jgi:serine/threonine protein phosphatase PrpC
MWLRLLRPFQLGGAKIVFETATLSEPGGREDNEDSVGYRMADGLGCWALADGLGGHRGGAVASRVAVDAVISSFEENPSIVEDALNTLILRANRAVLDRQAAEPELAQMRTTMALLIASPEAAMWAHAGDSRLYWLRNGRIQEQTKDDSVPQRLADAGEISADQIRFHEDRSRLLNSLGAREPVVASSRKMPGAPEPNDAFLLASDGFWECVTEAEMESDFGAATSSKAWIGKMEARVKQRALADHDNYSAIAVRVLKKRGRD